MDAPAQSSCQEPALPRSLAAYLPFLWSRVLFPGKPAPDSSRRWPSLLFLLIIPGVLLYPCMSFHLFEPDEGRYAQIPREMLEADEWLVPILQGQPYLDKPPLFYWLVMGSYTLFGAHEWSARLIPALAIHGCVLLTYFLGRRSLGERSAWWGALALALSPAFVGMGRLLVLDGVLAFFVTLSIFCCFEAVRGRHLRRRWWLLAALACGMGVLTKGPVALLLLVPPVWLYRRLNASGARITWQARLEFLGVTLLACAPWYVAMCFRLPGFAGYFFWEHNVVRFTTPFDHGRPIWFYGPILLAGLLPGSLLLRPFLRFLGTGHADVSRHRPVALGFMLLAGGWCVLFFSLSGCKLPTYILPSFPFLALALGHFLAHSRWDRSPATTLVTAAMLGLMVTAHFAVIPWAAYQRSPMNRPEEVAALCRDRRVPVICYPRPIDSVAFYLGRNDFRSYRSKQMPDLLHFLEKQPTTVVLFAHRHSLKQLEEVLPAGLCVTHTGPLGLCDLAVVQRREHANLHAENRVSR
jgi:4-amino-4-deoxy-L-arabinose transferase-like glycosyltransferase